MASKADTVRAVAGQVDGVSQDQAEQVINSFFDVVVAEIEGGGDISWPGVGKFSLSERGARMGRNPRTGESIEIGPSKSLKFTAAAALKKRLSS